MHIKNLVLIFASSSRASSICPLLIDLSDYTITHFDHLSLPSLPLLALLSLLAFLLNLCLHPRIILLHKPVDLVKNVSVAGCCGPFRTMMTLVVMSVSMTLRGMRPIMSISSSCLVRGWICIELSPKWLSWRVSFQNTLIPSSSLTESLREDGCRLAAECVLDGTVTRARLRLQRLLLSMNLGKLLFQLVIILCLIFEILGMTWLLLIIMVDVIDNLIERQRAFDITRALGALLFCCAHSIFCRFSLYCVLFHLPSVVILLALSSPGLVMIFKHCTIVPKFKWDYLLLYHQHSRIIKTISLPVKSTNMICISGDNLFFLSDNH